MLQFFHHSNISETDMENLIALICSPSFHRGTNYFIEFSSKILNNYKENLENNIKILYENEAKEYPFLVSIDLLLSN